MTRSRVKTIASRPGIAFGVVAMLLACVSVGSAQAGLMDYEPFAYSGDTLNGQNGGTGWSGGWLQVGSSPSNQLSDDGVSLSYPASFEPPATTPATSGSRVQTGGQSQNAGSVRLLSQPIDLSVDGTVRYASALFQKNAANGGGVNNDNILLEFVDDMNNRRWGLGIVGNGDAPWLNANGSTSASAPVVAGEDYFMVAKIVSSADGMDTAYLKVFGSGYSTQVPLAEPATWDATLTQTTAAVLDRLRIRIDPGNTSAAPGEVDEIRIGDTWASVTAIPEPATLGLAACGLIALAASRRKSS